MPFQITWDSQDAIPDNLKNLAVEKDGKFVLEGETAAEIENLKKTKNKERDMRTKYESEVKKLERFKPLAEAEEDEVEEFMERWNKRKEEPPKQDPNPDAAKQLELKDKLHAKELKRRDDELASIKSANEKAELQLKEFRLWTPLRDIAIKAGLVAEDWELARLDLSAKGRFGFDDEGAIVVIEDGHPSTITPERFFKEVYTDERPKFYHATGAGGGGANASAKNGLNAKQVKRETFNNMSTEARAKFFKDGGSVVD